MDPSPVLRHYSVTCSDGSASRSIRLPAFSEGQARLEALQRCAVAGFGWHVVSVKPGRVVR